MGRYNQSSGRNRQAQSEARIKDRMRKKLAQRKGQKTLCLTMIVKNESMNMVRLLDSVESIIDMISIVDTGSTDNTEEVILKWGKEHDIPTTVHHEPFKNFSYNRTHSVQMAKKAYPEADYLLLSDADFVWKINIGNKFDKVLLIDHKYLIEQKNKSLSYANIRILSAKVDWVCEGRTHEYWKESDSQSEYRGEVRTAKIKTLEIDDREDGGCKDDKFIRDERLLREGLEDPNERKDLKTRYKFYLAQTLKDLQRHKESIEWYKKRIEDGGWPEEVYYALFQTGFNYEQWAWKLKNTAILMEKAERTEGTYEKIESWNPNKIHHHRLSNNLMHVIALMKKEDRTEADDEHIKNWNPNGKSIEEITEIIELIRRNEKTIPDEEYIKKWNPGNLSAKEVMKKSTKRFADAADYYMKAYEYRKTRAESLYYLTRMYRILGLNEKSYDLAIIGRKISYPASDSLFIEMACYDYLFDFEISISSFYLPNKKDEGRKAISRLLQRDDLPDHIKNVVVTNSRYYI